MTTDKNGIQLEMNFEETGNRFKSRLDNGTFFILVEINPPPKKADLSASVERSAEIEYAVSSIKDIPVCLAFTDKYQNTESWNVGDFASRLCTAGRDNHLICLSGKNSSMEEVLDTMEFCRTAGFKNFFPVSGDCISGENFKETRKHVFTEGIHTLRKIKSHDDKSLFAGAAVNPFKYTPCDTFTQYFKLIKKINQGADFMVTQFGWDLMKLQELRWYLTSRSIFTPSIARLMMLTPDLVDIIAQGKYAGVHISPDFKTMLQKEVRYSYKQFESAQWRRLQLQAAGCRLLGYSGVQIAGLANAEQVNIVCRRIIEGLEEFDNFDSWKEAYFEHLARAEMAPYPHRFYMFNNIFSEAHLENTPSMTRGHIPECSRSEKMHYKLCKFLFANAAMKPADEHLISKKIFTGCKKCSDCRLPMLDYICPETCPKGISNGPCGGSRADGSCELGGMECIHSQRMRLAMWLGHVDALEESYIEPVERILKSKI